MTLVKKQSDNFFPTFFENFFNRDIMDWGNMNYSSTNTTLPAVNVRDTKDEYIIEVAAPGMKKDDFNIELENNQLTISSEKKEEREEKDEKFTRKEFSYQSFQRSFRLPVNIVEGSKISAKYDEGILCIKLPKREEVKPKPARIIKIS